MHSSAPLPLRSARASGLTGHIRVPGDKSMSHRALMFGAVAIGETAIRGLLEAEDVINTARAMTALGATAARGSDGVWRVQGVGVAGLTSPAAALDFGNSGTGVRLAMGLMSTTPLTARCVGDASLSRRQSSPISVALNATSTRPTECGFRCPSYGIEWGSIGRLLMHVTCLLSLSARCLANTCIWRSRTPQSFEALWPFITGMALESDRRMISSTKATSASVSSSNVVSDDIGL